MLFHACHPIFPKCPKCRTKTTAPLSMEIKPYGSTPDTAVSSEPQPLQAESDALGAVPLEQVVMISAKRRMLERMLDEATLGRWDENGPCKIVILSTVPETLCWVQRLLQLKGWTAFSMTTQLSAAQRGTRLQQFDLEKGRCCLVGPKSVVSFGLNLTVANVLIEMEPCLSLSEERQCVGRLHRTLQKRTVHHYVMITLGTLDKRMYDNARVRQSVQGGHRSDTVIEWSMMVQSMLSEVHHTESQQ